MKAQRRWFTPWLFVTPALIAVLVWSIYPFLNTVRLAFTNATSLRAGKWVGLDNFGRMFSDDQFWYAVRNSLVYMVVCIPLLCLLPLCMALLVQKTIPGITFFRTAFYTPVIASVVVAGLIWSWMLDSGGLVNNVLKGAGWIQKSLPFLTDPWLLVLSAISLTVWKGLGYYMVLYLAALGNVSRDLHEAAAVDGASPFRRFLSVTIPGVRGTMFLVAVLVAVSAFRVFTELYVLSNGSGGTGGRGASLVMLIQQAGSGLQGKLGYSSALSIVVFLITIGPLLILAQLNRRDSK